MLTLLLCPASRGWLDHLVATAEASPWIHAALDTGDSWVIEDVLPVLRVVPNDRFGPLVRRIPLTTTAEQEAALVAYLRARVGVTRYDVTQLALDAAGYATGHWFATPWQQRAAVCSGILSVAPRDPATVTPADLAAWADAGLPAVYVA